ncbi:MAG: hypothetical protein ACO34J_07790 [Prochlorothrix sp.]
MAPSKLSEADKQEIFQRYCNTDETTSTLAKQFGVSVSTISRLLKSQLSPGEYDELVRQKRLSNSRMMSETSGEMSDDLGGETRDLGSETRGDLGGDLASPASDETRSDETRSDEAGSDKTRSDEAGSEISREISRESSSDLPSKAETPRPVKVGQKALSDDREPADLSAFGAESAGLASVSQGNETLASDTFPSNSPVQSPVQASSGASSASDAAPNAGPDAGPITPAPTPVPLVAELAAFNATQSPKAAATSTNTTTGSLGLTLDSVGLGPEVPPLVASLPATDAGPWEGADDGDEGLTGRSGRRKRRRSSVDETPGGDRFDRPDRSASPRLISSPIDPSPQDSFSSDPGPAFTPSIPPITRAIPTTPSSPTSLGSPSLDTRDRASTGSTGFTPSGLPLPQPRSISRPSPAAEAQISLWADYPNAEESDEAEPIEADNQAEAPLPNAPSPGVAPGSSFRSTRSSTLVDLELEDNDDDEDEDEEEVLEDPAMAEYLAALGGDDFSSGDEDDEDEDEDDDFGDEDEEEDERTPFPTLSDRRDNTLLQVLPLTSANLPDTGYLVVDRTAELVTCPLSTFEELGQIPASEANNRTLPLFDNHRVARRFSKQNQRVVKLPNPDMIHKTLGCLGAKGITRLLVDGQVYSLDN